MTDTPSYLITARKALVSASEMLAAARKHGAADGAIELATRNLYRALDRVHEAQCMANGVFGT
jgi:hypothetical protein